MKRQHVEAAVEMRPVLAVLVWFASMFVGLVVTAGPQMAAGPKAANVFWFSVVVSLLVVIGASGMGKYRAAFFAASWPLVGAAATWLPGLTSGALIH